MIKFSKILAVFLLLLEFTSCETTGLRTISKREPSPVAAAIKVPEAQPEVIPDEKPKDLFVRKKDIKIRRKAPVNDTGSLTDLNDPRAYLFGFERPVDVGSFVDVKVASNRVDQKSDTKSPSEPTDSQAPKADDSSSILKALPNLEPGDKNHPALVTTIKMEVMERFDNGDVLVMHRRRSLRDGQASEIAVTARLPANALARQDQLATSDLNDIDWRESFDGEVIQRNSANWEDEYSLRLSGFEESRSKQAIAIEEKREQLKSSRDKLEKEMKAFLNERDKMTKERASLLETKTKDTEKISELEIQNKDLQKQVEDSAKDESSADTKSDGKKPAKGAEAKGDSKGDKKTDAKAASPAPKAADKKSAEKPPAAKNDAKK